jgi:hypothetical protein
MEGTDMETAAATVPPGHPIRIVVNDENFCGARFHKPISK